MDPELATAVAATPTPPPPEGTPTPKESRAWVDKALAQPFRVWQRTQLPDGDQSLLACAEYVSHTRSFKNLLTL